MKSLLEELDRIKSLMVYEKGKPLNEVSTKVVKTTASTSQSAAPKTKDVSTTILKALKKEENCVLVTHTENFNVNITVGEGAKKFHDKFINVLKEKFGNDLTGGHLALSDVKVFGGASNYNGGKVKPEWCNEYDVSKGTTSLKKWASGCAGFGDIEYKGNSGGTTRNTKLALNRAKNVLKELKTDIINSAKEANVKLPEGFDESEILYNSGTVYTGNKIDKSKPSGLNNGQIVMIDAKLCFVKDPEPEPEGCPDKCMEKDANGKCVCPESKGLKEVDGKCVCIDSNEPPDENCECKEKPKECPTCQEFDEKEERCKCQKGLKEEKDDEGKIKCVCPNEGEELIKSGKKCECKKQPKPPECNQTYEIKGGRGTKPYNFVTKAFQRKWPFEGTGQVTISFNPLVVPDAFYVKYGEQEFWSGFVGDIYKKGDGLYKMISVPKNIKNRFYKDIYPSVLTKDNNTRTVDRLPRIFAAELVWYKENDGLLESINAEISKVGGNPVNSIFKNGDGNAETITKKLKGVTKNLYQEWDKYGNVLKGDTSFTLKKESGEEENIMIIVFSPLAETLFNMKIECK
jgi:hypothetical protein